MKAHIVKQEDKNAAGRATNKRYYVVVELGRDSVTGKRIQKWHKVDGKTKDAAEAKLQELLQQVNGGTYAPPTDVTVGDYLDGYMKRLKRRFGQTGRDGLSEATWESYRRIFDHHVKPKLGGMRLTDLKPAHIDKYETDMLENGWAHWGKQGPGKRTRGLSPTTVLQHHRVLKTALKAAVPQYIPSNPCDAVRPPGAADKHLRVLDADEASDLIRMAQGSDLEVSILIALTTGMRAGEICALKRRDCDLDGATVRVLRAATAIGGQRREKAPKSGEGRSIRIGATTVAALRAHFDARKVRSIQRDEYVVCDQHRKPWASNDLSKAFRAFAKRHKLEDLRFHDLRHTHATILAAAGVHPRVVQERLGHADVAFTLRRYTGYWANMQETAAQVTETLLGEAVGSQLR